MSSSVYTRRDSQGVRQNPNCEGFYAGMKFDALRTDDEVVLDGMVRGDGGAPADVVATGAGEHQYGVRLRDDGQKDATRWGIQWIGQS